MRASRFGAGSASRDQFDPGDWGEYAYSCKEGKKCEVPASLAPKDGSQSLRKCEPGLG